VLQERRGEGDRVGGVRRNPEGIGADGVLRQEREEKE
jgi:hypothetical protein